MPKGGFGNLVALSLQKAPRERRCSMFVDAELRPYPDQWAYLAAIRPMDSHDIEPTILRAIGNTHPLDEVANDCHVRREFLFGRHPIRMILAYAKKYAHWTKGEASSIHELRGR
jgi:hypothetical protein